MTKKSMRDGSDEAVSNGVATASADTKGSKHTQGPWQVLSSGGRPYAVSTMPHNRFVVNWGGLAKPAQPATRANASLIAAAPDMYAAIAGAMEYLESHLGACDAGCECILHPLRAAIAKAEAK